MFTCKCGGLYSSVIMDVKVLKAKNKIYRHIYTNLDFHDIEFLVVSPYLVYGTMH